MEEKYVLSCDGYSHAVVVASVDISAYNRWLMREWPFTMRPMPIHDPIAFREYEPEVAEYYRKTSLRLLPILRVASELGQPCAREALLSAAEALLIVAERNLPAKCQMQEHRLPSVLRTLIVFLNSVSALDVFVSFSLPEPTFMQLVRMFERAGGEDDAAIEILDGMGDKARVQLLRKLANKKARKHRRAIIFLFGRCSHQKRRRKPFIAPRKTARQTRTGGNGDEDQRVIDRFAVWNDTFNLHPFLIKNLIEAPYLCRYC